MRYIETTNIASRAMQTMIMFNFQQETDNWNHSKRFLTIESSRHLSKPSFTAVVHECVEDSFTFIVDTESVNLNTTEGDSEVVPEVQEFETEPAKK